MQEVHDAYQEYLDFCLWVHGHTLNYLKTVHPSQDLTPLEDALASNNIFLIQRVFEDTLKKLPQNMGAEAYVCGALDLATHTLVHYKISCQTPEDSAQVYADLLLVTRFLSRTLQDPLAQILSTTKHSYPSSPSHFPSFYELQELASLSLK